MPGITQLSRSRLVQTPNATPPGSLVEGDVYWNADREQVMARSGSGAFPVSQDATFPIVKTGYWYSLPVNGANATLVPTLSRMYAMPFVVPRVLTLASVGIEVTTLTASSLLRVGLYDSDSAGELPGALLSDAGTVSTATTGVKTWTFSQALQPGHLYFVAAAAQTAAATVRVRNSSDPLIGDPSATPSVSIASAYWIASITGAFPNPFGTIGATAVQGPCVSLKFS